MSLSQRHKKFLEDYKVYQKSKERAIDVELNDYGFVTIRHLGREKPVKYNPIYVPHLLSFLNDASVPYKIIIGAYGSGKTSGLVNAVLRDAVIAPKCDDGIRRSRIAFIRNTAGQLETTTLNTWVFWTRGLPAPTRVKKPQLTYTYNFHDADGEIQLEVIFLALDREYDVSKLDSLELTSAVFNEVRHIPKKIFDTVMSRIGRYPPKILYEGKFKREFKGSFEDEEGEEDFYKKWRPFKPKIYADTNPPKHNHWIADLEKSVTKNIKIYHQPPALIKDKNGVWNINRDADNLKFVGEDYYLEMIDRGEEFVKVYACGLYGTVVDGKPVYPNYNDELHSEDDLEVIHEETIYIGCDYGITCPAVVLCQFYGTRLRFFKEFIGEYESIRALFEGAVIPYLKSRCQKCPLEVIGDPADTSNGRAQLEALGLNPEPALTNKVEERIAAVTNALNMLVNGRSRFVISRNGCPTLREGFLGEYHYRRLKIVGDEKYVDVPNKVHPYSDIHDAVQYVTQRICMETGLTALYSRLPSRDALLMNEKDTSYRSKVTGY